MSAQTIRHALGLSLMTALAVALVLGVRVTTGAITTIWLPAGIAMAAYYMQPIRNWPLLTLCMFAIVGPTFYLSNSPPLRSFGFILGLTTQSMICAAISLAVLSDREKLPQSTWHIAGLFLAAVIGSICGGLLVLPFHTDQTLYYFSWWALSNIVGILSATTLTINVWRRITGKTVFMAARVDTALILSLCGCAALTIVILQVATLVLFPLLVLAIVLIGSRFGQLGSSSAVLVVGVSAFLLSIFTESPVPGLDLPAAQAGLLLQGWMLMLLAIALPMAATLLKREALERELRQHNDRLHDNITILGLAEQLAGIGRYRIDLRSGAQEWSPQMLEMHGLPSELAPDPGDLARILPDGGERLFVELERNRHEQMPYSFDYCLKPYEQMERILRMSILNEFDRAGERIAIFGVAIDVTDQMRREEALDLARGRAVRLAAEAQKIANTDVLTGLPNRRCTFNRLQTMVEDAENRRRPLAAIMFDIDHFKQVNDRHGHQAGDDVLVRVAELARHQTRADDLVGRIGGEEFVWLLPDVPPREVGRLAERLRSAIEKGTRGQNYPHVTASIGMAMSRAGDDGEALLARADAALYDAKQGGRNQVKRAA